MTEKSSNDDTCRIWYKFYVPFEDFWWEPRQKKPTMALFRRPIPTATRSIGALLPMRNLFVYTCCARFGGRDGCGKRIPMVDLTADGNSRFFMAVFSIFRYYTRRMTPFRLVASVLYSLGRMWQGRVGRKALGSCRYFYIIVGNRSSFDEKSSIDDVSRVDTS